MQKPGMGRVWRRGDLKPARIQLWDTRDRLSSFTWSVCKQAGSNSALSLLFIWKVEMSMLLLSDLWSEIPEGW